MQCSSNVVKLATPTSCCVCNFTIRNVCTVLRVCQTPSERTNGPRGQPVPYLRDYSAGSLESWNPTQNYVFTLKTEQKCTTTKNYSRTRQIQSFFVSVYPFRWSLTQWLWRLTISCPCTPLFVYITYPYNMATWFYVGGRTALHPCIPRRSVYGLLVIRDVIW